MYRYELWGLLSGRKAASIYLGSIFTNSQSKAELFVVWNRDLTVWMTCSLIIGVWTLHTEATVSTNVHQNHRWAKRR